MVKKGFLNRKITGNALRSFGAVNKVMVKGENARNRKTTIQEYIKLYAVAQEHVKPMIVMANNTGMRVGELYKLRWSYIYERAGFIRQYQLKRENIELQVQVKETQKKLAYLKTEIDALKNDIDRIKQEAIRHGFAEPDEVIIQLR